MGSHNDIFYFLSEEYFSLYQGRWTVSEYICNTYDCEVLDIQELTRMNIVIRTI